MAEPEIFDKLARRPDVHVLQGMIDRRFIGIDFGKESASVAYTQAPGGGAISTDKVTLESIQKAIADAGVVAAKPQQSGGWHAQFFFLNVPPDVSPLLSDIQYWRDQGLMPTDEHGRGILVWKHVNPRMESYKRPIRRSLVHLMEDPTYLMEDPTYFRPIKAETVNKPHPPYQGNLGYPYEIGKYFKNYNGMAVPGPTGAIRDWGIGDPYPYVLAIYTNDLRPHTPRSGVFYALSGIPVALYRAERDPYDGEFNFYLVEGEDALALIL